MNIPPAPQAWLAARTPLGLELTYFARKDRGFALALAVAAVVTVFCGYQILSFLLNWFRDKAGILPAGVILFLLMIGGLLVGLRFLSVAFRSSQYRLGEFLLEIDEMRPGRGTKKEQIEKGNILEVLCLKTPSKEAGSPDTWRTGISLSEPSGKNRNILIEGTTKEESDFLSGILTAWAGVKRKEENTME